MKLFLKILLSIFSMLLTTVGEIKSSTVLNLLQEEKPISSFLDLESTSFDFENHSGNFCLNRDIEVIYNERIKRISGEIAKERSGLLKVEQSTLQHIFSRHSKNFGFTGIKSSLTCRRIDKWKVD